jgi:hypothetical protein
VDLRKARPTTPRQTRCDVVLVLHKGSTYAIPQDDSWAAYVLRRWAIASRALHLDVVVTAGTIVTGAEVGHGVLVACDLYGSSVLVPRAVLEEMY